MLFNKTLYLTGLGFVSLKLGICRFPLSLSSSSVCNISHWTALSYRNLILTNLYDVHTKRKNYANLFYNYFFQNRFSSTHFMWMTYPLIKTWQYRETGSTVKQANYWNCQTPININGEEAFLFHAVWFLNVLNNLPAEQTGVDFI